MSHFTPLINLPQEQSYDTPHNFNVDYVNFQVFSLQNMTRCAAIINYIENKNSNYGGGGGDGNGNGVTTVDNIFSTYLKTCDPIDTFTENFVEFFGIYINSIFGPDTFKMYFYESSDKLVPFPISVNICEQNTIFMVYDKEKLREYFHRVLIMYYFYAGDSFSVVQQKRYDRDIGNKVEELIQFNITQDETKVQNQQKRKISRLMKTLTRNTCKVTSLETTTAANMMTTSTTAANGTYVPPPLMCIIPMLNDNNNDFQQQIMDKNCAMNTNRWSVLHDNLYYNNGTTIAASTSTDLINSLNYYKNSKRVQADNIQKIQLNFNQVWQEGNHKNLVNLSIIHTIMEVCLRSILANVFHELDNDNTLAKNIDLAKASIEITLKKSQLASNSGLTFNDKFTFS